MRKGLLAFILPLLLLSVLAVPTVSADPLYVHSASATQADVDAGESAQFQWVIYNNDTSPYLLKVTSALDRTSDAWDVSLSQYPPIIEPGEYAVVTATVNAHRDVGNEDLVLSMAFDLTKLNGDPSASVHLERTAQVTLHAMFESTGNRIFGVWANDLPSPFNTLLWSFIITLAVWVAIAAAIYFVVNPLIHQFTKKTKTDLDDRIVQIVRMPMFILIVLFGLVDSLSIVNIPTEWHIRIWQAYQIIVALVATWIAYRVFDRVVIHYADKWAKKSDTEIDDVLVPLLHKVGIIAIPVVGVGLVLDVVGVDLTLLVAGMGVVGLIVAFAAQETLGNVFSGIQLLLDRPFKVGDLIELDTGEVCEVKRVGIRSTQLYNTYDHEMIIVPNNEVANKRVINHSRPDNHRCVYADVRVVYGTDLDKARAILMDIVSKHPDVVRQEGQLPFLRLAKLGESAVEFRLWFWVDHVRKQWRVATEIRTEIYKKFREEGIEIALPQEMVTFRNAPPTDGP